MIKTVQHVDPFDTAPFTMVVMPTDEVVFIHPRFFLNSVIEYQDTVLGLNLTDS
jgi:hypothetical protein